LRGENGEKVLKHCSQEREDLRPALGSLLKKTATITSFTFLSYINILEQGVSNHGTCTTSCMPATVQGYTGLIRGKRKDKKYK
jgi:hypothetical protein